METLFKVSFFVGLIVIEIIRAPHRARNKRERREGKMIDTKVRGIEAVLLTVSFFTLYLLPLVYIFSSLLDFADYSLPVALGLLGIPLVVLAAWITWRAHADLGRNWSPSLEVTQEQKLVTQGIYHNLRHPIYTAMFLFTIAQALLLQNWLAGLGGLISYIPIYLTRVPREEQMMLDHFGDEYRDYMRQTGRFLPRLGK
jgi:protein-S-isoprenylcysteine O-methyltransferase Ste14